jgi:cob(I)alamin adenosyltransferase
MNVAIASAKSMSKIYTKTGDLGETGLFGGKRVVKSCNSISALGDMDELNASLGVARLHLRRVDSIKLAQIQKDLFTLGSTLAGFTVDAGDKKSFSTKVAWLEKEINALDKKLPKLKTFILPYGCESSARLHLARAICRRCERSLVALGRNAELIPYINRLSDYLFTLARHENQSHKVKDELVGPRNN